MPGPNNPQEKSSGAKRGIAKAVREGAKSARTDEGESAGSAHHDNESRPGRGERLGGTPNLAAAAARSVLTNALKSRGGDVEELTLIHQTAAELVRNAADADDDGVLSTVEGVVSGAIDAARETGIDEEKAAKAAAMGAIEGAGEMGEATVERVKEFVTRPIGAITPVDEAVFAKGRRTP